jgi:hypothetical protein
MTRLVSWLCLAGVLAIGAEDPWAKVRAIKSGSELRILKREAKQPLLATFDEATDERIVVVVKNEQVSIPKEDIERIDARPKTGRPVTRETKTTTSAPGNPAPVDQRPGGGPPGPSGSSSSSLTFGSKPDFETVYRRPPVPAAPKR